MILTPRQFIIIKAVLKKRRDATELRALLDENGFDATQPALSTLIMRMRVYHLVVTKKHPSKTRGLPLLYWPGPQARASHTETKKFYQ